MRMLAALAVIVPLGAVSTATECDHGDPRALGEVSTATSCDHDDPRALLVPRSSVLQRSTEATNKMPTTTCQPCKVEEEFNGVHLKIEIFAKPKDWTRPFVLMFHGSGGGLWQTNKICKNLFSAGNRVCASVLNERYEDEIKVTEAALSYLTENAVAYAINPGKFFLYGYSRGAIHLAKFMTSSGSLQRNKILGLVSDSGTPQKYWDDLTENEKVLPPILMLHCDKDPKMKPKNTIDKGIKNIKKVNKAREGKGTPLVQYHYMKYTKKSNCTHDPRAHVPSGLDAMKGFITQMLSIYNGDKTADPFEGIPLEFNGEEQPW